MGKRLRIRDPCGKTIQQHPDSRIRLLWRNHNGQVQVLRGPRLAPNLNGDSSDNGVRDTLGVENSAQLPGRGE